MAECNNKNKLLEQMRNNQIWNEKKIQEVKQKVEPKEMTEKDAWNAMANGECVKTSLCIHRIKELTLEWWDCDLNGSGKWMTTSGFENGPYSIVPDPSKPEKKVDEYEADRQRIIAIVSDEDNLPEYQARKLIEFLERNFQRKEAK
jgi:hypothetical protein